MPAISNFSEFSQDRDSQPPPFRGPQQAPPTKRGGGKWIFLLLGIVIGGWLFGKLVKPQRIVVTTPIAVSSATDKSSATNTSETSETLPASTPSQVADLAPSPTTTPIPEKVDEWPHPVSDNFIPKEIKLIDFVSFPKYELGEQIGFASPPLGTKLRLVSIKGNSIIVEKDGKQKTISAVSTDLLDRMVGIIDDTTTPLPTSSATPGSSEIQQVSRTPLVSLEFKNGAVFPGHIIAKSPLGVTFQTSDNNMHKIPRALLTDKTVIQLSLGAEQSPTP